jgi:RNA polymerase sigma-70 factor (ECF subfamily)
MDRTGALSPSPPPSRPVPVLAPAPLQQIFRQYAAFVAALALRLIGRDDEVDDIVQEVFLVAVRGVHALRDPEAVRAWLATITVRLTRKRLRALRLKRWCGLDEAPGYVNLAAPGATPEDRALLARIYEILDRLPADHRMSWCLRHVQGYELEAIADMCDCSLATAKRWIAAAHGELQKAVADA